MMDKASARKLKQSHCPHQYVVSTLYKPTYCDDCGQFIWGISAQAIRCNRCNLTLHHECHAKRRSDDENDNDDNNEKEIDFLPQPDELEELNEKKEEEICKCAAGEHVLKIVNLTLPTHCNVCDGFLWGGIRHTGLQCVHCNGAYTIHEACYASVSAEDGNNNSNGLVTIVESDRQKLRSHQQHAEPDPHSDAIVTETWRLMHDFQKRHGVIINPLRLYHVYSDGKRRFRSTMDALAEGMQRVRIAEVEHLRSALRYATAAYGPFYFEGHMFALHTTVLVQAIGKTFPTDDSVASVLGIPTSKILHSRWTDRAFEPCYYCTIDEVRKCVIFAIRGSMSKGDALTDLCGHVEPWLNNTTNDNDSVMAAHIHSGVGRVVDLLFDTSKCALIPTILNETPADYPILVTGHSLGAAAATAFTVRCLEEKTFGPDRVVRCVGFGSPPVLTEPHASRYDSVITNVVAGVDVVPRLSLNAIERLGAELAGTTAISFGPELYLVGRVLVMADDGRVIAAPRGSGALMRLILSSRMFEDHVPETYAVRLDKYLVWCEKDQQKQEEMFG
eukprot:PhM_4_TR12730/c0_g1_i1/m.105046